VGPIVITFPPVVIPGSIHFNLLSEHAFTIGRLVKISGNGPDRQRILCSTPLAPPAELRIFAQYRRGALAGENARAKVGCFYSQNTVHTPLRSVKILLQFVLGSCEYLQIKAQTEMERLKPNLATIWRC
jgi:hypothetical protein